MQANGSSRAAGSALWGTSRERDCLQEKAEIRRAPHSHHTTPQCPSAIYSNSPCSQLLLACKITAVFIHALAYTHELKHTIHMDAYRHTDVYI
uniref:Uncharacterized protein n=1 Tax=Anguilla anguilla TaxID=7936 RepID=A0A0E9WS93_ANGAN